MFFLMMFQVFIRELISNASDSLEKLRYLQLTSNELKEKDAPLEIHIAVNDDKKTFIIQVNSNIFDNWQFPVCLYGDVLYGDVCKRVVEWVGVHIRINYKYQFVQFTCHHKIDR